MADVGLNAVFPNAKFLTTNAKGDIQEIIGVDASSSRANIDGIEITSVATGTSSNGIVFEITEKNTEDSISANNNTITLALDKNASDYRLNSYGIDTDVNAHHLDIVNGEYIYFIADDTLNLQNQDTTDMESIDFVEGDSFLVIDEDGTGRPIAEINGTNYAFYAGNYKTTWGRRLEKLSTIFATAGTDVDSLVTITQTGQDKDSLTGTGSVTLSDAVDATDGELESNKSYLIISSDDIFDYDGPEEEADGRKVFYGLLETATSNISNLSDKPNNLQVNRGNLILLSDNKMRRSYSVTATLDILDSDLSAE